MKYIILILSILIMFSSSLVFGMMQIKLESISQEFILGEWADVIKITWKNDGEKDLIIPYRIRPFHDNERLIKWHVIGPSRIECKQRREPEVKWVPLAHEILKAGAEKSLPISLGQLGIVDIGAYEIWMEYDSTNLVSSWDEVHITRIKTISNHIKIQLN